MKKAALLKEYMSFWTSFRAVCVSAGRAIKPSDGSSIQIDEAACNAREHVIKTLSYFPDWPYKAVSKNDKIHILSKSREVYDYKLDRICRSSVQVLYATVDADVATPLLALHYDFVLPVQPAHPVFHAQLGATNFVKRDLESLGIHFALDPAKVPLYSNLRIPTPCMNFASVILGIAADHLPQGHFNRILKLTRQSDLSTWNADCAALEKSMADGGYLPSHHWY